jgi:hypothetical protein
MLKNRLFYTAAFIGAAVFHIYYNGWFSWYLLIFAVCLPPFSLLLSLSAMLHIQLTANPREFCTRGETVTVRFTDESKSIMPVPGYRFKLIMTDIMTGKRSVRKIRLSGSKHGEAIIDTAHCGTVQCAFERGLVYDYLGLIRLSFKLPKAFNLAVFPKPAAPEPLPDLTKLQSKTYRPKIGGGFSEIHDMRDYRPGDSVRDIHWKLSAKTDNLVVREPQELNRGLILLTFDLSGTPEELDQIFDQLAWLSDWLLKHEVNHDVRWLDPVSSKPMSVSVRDDEDLRSLMALLLKTRLAAGSPTIINRVFTAVDWRYHIRPFAAGEDAAKEADRE